MSTSSKLRHRAVLFYGGGFGSGKTSLASTLEVTLAQKGFRTTWVCEDSWPRMSEFAPVVESIQGGYLSDLELLIAQSKAFLDSQVGGDSVLISDTVFPWWDLLHYHRLTTIQVETYAELLYPSLALHNPILVFLDCDVEKTFARAMKERGPLWAAMVMRHAQLEPGLENLRDFVRSQSKIHAELIQRWPFAKFDIDTVKYSQTQCEEMIMERLEF